MRALPRTAIAPLAFGLLDLSTAGIVALGVFVGLPARWAPVDVVAAVVALLDAASGVLLLVALRAPARRALARKVARVAAIVSLVVGLALVAVLALTAGYLAGIYGPVGKGGAVILTLVAALALPYLVGFPAAQLAWTLPAPGGSNEPEPAAARDA